MKILKVDPINPDGNILEEAARVLKSGDVVAFPTETVYGLGAIATDENACMRIFEAKGRPPDNPLIVHISNMDMFYEYTDFHDRKIISILEEIWPGPITIVVNKKNLGNVPTANLDTVAIRMPGHPVPLKLIDLVGKPIAAPSANRSGKPSPTLADHVIEDLGGMIPLIIDGGPTFFGVESTVIMPKGDKIYILRPGPFSPEEIRDKFQMKVEVSTDHSDAPRAPGMKYRHYAPSKRLLLARDFDHLLELCNEYPESLVLCSDETSSKLKCKTLVLGSSENLYVIAKNLFDSFRKLDSSNYKMGIIETFPEKGIGYAIMNRIKKAAEVI